ncbi:hypothetical protein ACFVZT_46355 [Streptomyces sp. NPDC058321]|uniref:hypothetical protein n=1 Tax=unclassified Streptomyces TaxID=2593676 RepID=UPI0036F17F5D
MQAALRAGIERHHRLLVPEGATGDVVAGLYGGKDMPGPAVPLSAHGEALREQAHALYEAAFDDYGTAAVQRAEADQAEGDAATALRTRSELLTERAEQSSAQATRLMELETVRHPAEFARVARRAAAAGKPIVALKIGASKLASRTAQAHTGALVGDDHVVDAAFRRLGIIRVHSLEELILTAGLLARTGPLPGPRIGVVTPSGGACEIIADRAEQEGLEIPAFAPATTAQLKESVPEFATVQNPLDVTGYVLVDRTLLARALKAVAADPVGRLVGRLAHGRWLPMPVPWCVAGAQIVSSTTTGFQPTCHSEPEGVRT